MDQEYSSPKAANLRGYRTPNWKLVWDARQRLEKEMRTAMEEVGDIGVFAGE